MGGEDFVSFGDRLLLGEAGLEIGQEGDVGEVGDADGVLHGGKLLGALGTADFTEKAVGFDEFYFRAKLGESLIFKDGPETEAVDADRCFLQLELFNDAGGVRGEIGGGANAGRGNPAALPD